MTEIPSSLAADPPGARPRYGVRTLTLLVIASMVGAGVFTTSGYTLQSLGTPARVIAAWGVAGGIALAGAVSYGQLVRAMPESGGEYLFLARAAHPGLGFIAGWVSLFAGFTGAIAFAATAFAGYVVPASAPAWLNRDVVAVAAIAAGAMAHGIQPRRGAWLQNAVVALKLCFLVVFLGFAATRITAHAWRGGALPTASAGTPVPEFAMALVWISLSYSGFNGAVYVAEEAHNPKRDVPKALLYGTLTVIVLYVVLNSVFVFAPPAELIAGKEDIAAITAEWLGGAGWALFMRSIIALALLTSVLSMMMAAPRVYAKMAEDGLMPAFLKFRGAAPRRAIVGQAVLAALFVLVSTLQGLLNYLGLTLSLCAAASVACLLSPRVRRLPWWHVQHLPAVVYITGTVGAAVIMTLHRPGQVYGTLVTFLLGGTTYLVARSKARTFS